ncbi:MAG: pyridoxal phosphate-dependent aminotransferase [Candidatus Aminicenantes bacterium]|nr:pyridoxal phosphate-dependent aminotransferase [Candidatus Aminicenantes bacterium]
MNRPEGSLISYFSNRVKKEGGINLAQGTPGFPPPPPLLTLLKKIAGDKPLHQYPPGIGDFDLLELIRQKYSSVASPAPLSLDNLLVVQGATEGIFLTFFYLTTFLERPFSALSFDPVYESYPQLADMFRVPFEYMDFIEKAGVLSVDFDRLEKTILEKKVKIVFIASPGNPLGKIWDREELTQLVSLSRAYGFYILFDAVYKDIYFAEPPFNPLALNHEKLFYIDSFSKTLSITGWRVGYIIAAAEPMKKIRGIHDYTGLCAPSILQAAIARYLSDFNFGQEYIATVKKKCKNSYAYMKKAMIQLGFDVKESRGGYFLWAKLPPPRTDAFTFALALYSSSQVAVVPGENFSRTKTDYIRVNIGTGLPIIREAVLRIKGFFI